MNKEETIWQQLHQINAKIKRLGLSLDDIKDLLRQKEEIDRQLVTQRSQQFSNTLEGVLRAHDRQEQGLLLRQFAEHVLNEARMSGLSARTDIEALLDEMPDMGTTSEENEDQERISPFE